MPPFFLHLPAASVRVRFPAATGCTRILCFTIVCAICSLMAHRPLILATLCLCAFAVNLDVTLVNVTLPRLVVDLGAGTKDLQWIVDAYTLTFAALVLAAGSLGDRFGRRRHADGRPRRLRDRQRRRIAGRQHRRADRDPGDHGGRCGDHLPDDPLDHHQRLHRARRAGPGDRAVGCEHRYRDRARTDRRRRPARVFLLAGDLPGQDSGGDSWRSAWSPGSCPTSRDPEAPRLDFPGLAALHRDDRRRRLRDHRGPVLRLDLDRDAGRLRPRSRPARRLHLLGAPRRRADARHPHLPQHALLGRVDLGDGRRSSRSPGSSS